MLTNYEPNNVNKLECYKIWKSENTFNIRNVWRYDSECSEIYGLTKRIQTVWNVWWLTLNFSSFKTKAAKEINVICSSYQNLFEFWSSQKTASDSKRTLIENEECLFQQLLSLQLLIKSHLQAFRVNNKIRKQILT